MRHRPTSGFGYLLAHQLQERTQCRSSQTLVKMTLVMLQLNNGWRCFSLSAFKVTVCHFGFRGSASQPRPRRLMDSNAEDGECAVETGPEAE